MEVDRRGIARTHAALGGEGTYLLALRNASVTDATALDAALPPDAGDGPARGGWFPGPRAWLLLVEGLPGEVDPWVDALARRLDGAGIGGTLGGAGAVGPPTWARSIHTQPMLTGLVGYRPAPGAGPYDGWTPEPAALEAAVGLAARWVDVPGASVTVSVDLQAALPADASAVARVMAADARRAGAALAEGYVKSRTEVREAGLVQPGGLDLTCRAAGLDGRALAAELREVFTTMPLHHVTVASVSRRTWGDLKQVRDDDAPFHGRAYGWHPERWDDLVLEPAGVMVLTDTHLERASDLSAWTTTRLDDEHVLLEAADLDAWYATPDATPPTELLEAARQDFGAMLLTPALARELGLADKPPRRTG